MNDTLGKNITNALNRVVSGLGDVMSVLARKAVPHIRQRTRRGIDDQGVPFNRYTEKYAKRKRQNKVDLYGNRRVTKNNTRMLDSLAIVSEPTSTFSSLGGGNSGRFRSKATGQFTKASSQSVVIGFRDPRKAKIAGYHMRGSAGQRNGQGASPAFERRFMGLEKSFVEKHVAEAFGQLVNNSFSSEAQRASFEMRLFG